MARKAKLSLFAVFFIIFILFSMQILAQPGESASELTDKQKSILEKLDNDPASVTEEEANENIDMIISEGRFENVLVVKLSQINLNKNFDKLGTQQLSDLANNKIKVNQLTQENIRKIGISKGDEALLINVTNNLNNPKFQSDVAVGQLDIIPNWNQIDDGKIELISSDKLEYWGVDSKGKQKEPILVKMGSRIEQTDKEQFRIAFNTLAGNGESQLTYDLEAGSGANVKIDESRFALVMGDGKEPKIEPEGFLDDSSILGFRAVKGPPSHFQIIRGTQSPTRGESKDIVVLDGLKVSLRTETDAKKTKIYWHLANYYESKVTYGAKGNVDVHAAIIKKESSNIFPKEVLVLQGGHIEAAGLNSFYEIRDSNGETRGIGVLDSDDSVKLDISSDGSVTTETLGGLLIAGNRHLIRGGGRLVIDSDNNLFSLNLIYDPNEISEYNNLDSGESISAAAGDIRIFADLTQYNEEESNLNIPLDIIQEGIESFSGEVLVLQGDHVEASGLNSFYEIRDSNGKTRGLGVLDTDGSIKLDILDDGSVTAETKGGLLIVGNRHLIKGGGRLAIDSDNNLFSASLAHDAANPSEYNNIDNGEAVSTTKGNIEIFTDLAQYSRAEGNKINLGANKKAAGFVKFEDVNLAYEGLNDKSAFEKRTEDYDDKVFIDGPEGEIARLTKKLSIGSYLADGTVGVDYESGITSDISRDKNGKMGMTLDKRDVLSLAGIRRDPASVIIIRNNMIVALGKGKEATPTGCDGDCPPVIEYESYFGINDRLGIRYEPSDGKAAVNILSFDDVVSSLGDEAVIIEPKTPEQRKQFKVASILRDSALGILSEYETVKEEDMTSDQKEGFATAQKLMLQSQMANLGWQIDYISKEGLPADNLRLQKAELDAQLSMVDGNYDEAGKKLQAFIGETANNKAKGLAYIDLAQIYETKESKPEDEEISETALDLYNFVKREYPELSQTVDATLANSYAQRGNYLKAREHFANVISESSNAQEAQSAKDWISRQDSLQLLALAYSRSVNNYLQEKARNTPKTAWSALFGGKEVREAMGEEYRTEYAQYKKEGGRLGPNSWLYLRKSWSVLWESDNIWRLGEPFAGRELKETRLDREAEVKGITAISAVIDSGRANNIKEAVALIEENSKSSSPDPNLPKLSRDVLDYYGSEPVMRAAVALEGELDQAKRDAVMLKLSEIAREKNDFLTSVSIAKTLEEDSKSAEIRERAAELAKDIEGIGAFDVSDEFLHSGIKEGAKSFLHPGNWIGYGMAVQGGQRLLATTGTGRNILSFTGTGRNLLGSSLGARIATGVSYEAIKGGVGFIPKIGPALEFGLDIIDGGGITVWDDNIRRASIKSTDNMVDGALVMEYNSKNVDNAFEQSIRKGITDVSEVQDLGNGFYKIIRRNGAELILSPSGQTDNIAKMGLGQLMGVSTARKAFEAERVWSNAKFNPTTPLSSEGLSPAEKEMINVFQGKPRDNKLTRAEAEDFLRNFNDYNPYGNLAQWKQQGYNGGLEGIIFDLEVRARNLEASKQASLMKGQSLIVERIRGTPTEKLDIITNLEFFANEDNARAWLLFRDKFGNQPIINIVDFIDENVYGHYIPQALAKPSLPGRSIELARTYRYDWYSGTKHEWVHGKEIFDNLPEFKETRIRLWRESGFEASYYNNPYFKSIMDNQFHTYAEYGVGTPRFIEAVQNEFYSVAAEIYIHSDRVPSYPAMREFILSKKATDPLLAKSLDTFIENARNGHYAREFLDKFDANPSLYRAANARGNDPNKWARRSVVIGIPAGTGVLAIGAIATGLILSDEEETKIEPNIHSEINYYLSQGNSKKEVEELLSMKYSQKEISFAFENRRKAIARAVAKYSNYVLTNENVRVGWDFIEQQLKRMHVSDEEIKSILEERKAGIMNYIQEKRDKGLDDRSIYRESIEEGLSFEMEDGTRSYVTKDEMYSAFTALEKAKADKVMDLQQYYGNRWIPGYEIKDSSGRQLGLTNFVYRNADGKVYAKNTETGELYAFDDESGEFKKL